MLTPPSLSEAKPIAVQPVLVEWFLLIRPEKIGWLRFILEGYDGLAMVSTVSVPQGLVRMQTLDCRFEEAMRLIGALATDLTPFPLRQTAGIMPEKNEHNE